MLEDRIKQSSNRDSIEDTLDAYVLDIQVEVAKEVAEEEPLRLVRNPFKVHPDKLRKNPKIIDFEET